MKMIVAHANYRAIGKGNELPWNVPEDMKFFVKKTKEAKELLVGKKTRLSLPEKGLKDRTLNVLSTSFPSQGTGSVFRTLEEAIIGAKEKDMMIIGGEQIYRAFLPYVSTLFVTEIEVEVKGADAFFPLYYDDFELEDIIEKGVSNGTTYTIKQYKRRL